MAPQGKKGSSFKNILTLPILGPTPPGFGKIYLWILRCPTRVLSYVFLFLTKIVRSRLIRVDSCKHFLTHSCSFCTFKMLHASHMRYFDWNKLQKLSNDFQSTLIRIHALHASKSIMHFQEKCTHTFSPEKYTQDGFLQTLFRRTFYFLHFCKCLSSYKISVE